MLFAPKSKGFFVDQNESLIVLARTSAPSGPRVIEDITEVAPEDADAWAEVMAQYLPKKASNALLQAVCGVYPENRLLRRLTLDLKRIKEAGYMTDLISSQFRIDPEAYIMALVNSADGLEYDMAKPAHGEVGVCGMRLDEVLPHQNALLERSVYPDRLEVGSVSTVGALIDYAKFKTLPAPTLVLEMGFKTTHSYIISANGLEASRPIPQGLEAMVPVVQKELGLKDEQSAQKLFYSNTFDFTGMGPALIKKLLRELQSSIGFFEVQTGQSIGQVICTLLPPKLEWLEGAIASQLAVAPLVLDLPEWLESHKITLGDRVAGAPLSRRWLGLFSLMVQYHAAPSEEKA